ncbi:MAG: asparagine synthase (glutamine-hydrolyzing) [Pseudomonadota bacterium]
MCGIAGFFGDVGQPADHHLRLIDMLGLQLHRGPDEAGYYCDRRVGLATARLSIIDLSGGQQPLQDTTGRFWIAYNGEIYNYVEIAARLRKEGIELRTRSDTEVFLESFKLWGTAAFEQFNGGFAAAIYDSTAGNITLVRDRFGKRPLYLAKFRKGFLFSSELKSFAAFPGFHFRVDPTALGATFLTWTPLPDTSIFEGVEQLAPGHFLQWQDDRVATTCYAELTFPEPSWEHDYERAQTKVRELLEQSVSIRLRSDVEVGSYLSGGLDSAIATTLAQRMIGKRIKTFSVTFTDKEFDESRYQQTVQNHLDIDHVGLQVSGIDIAENFEAALWHAEAPVFRTAFVPMYLLSKLVRANGIKVVLTGEGADEMFLGYNVFKETALRSRWSNLDEATRNTLIKELYPYQAHFSESRGSVLSSLFERFQEERFAGWFSHELRLNNGLLALRLLPESIKDAASVQIERLVSPMLEHFANWDVIGKAQWLESKTLLAGYLLSTQGDRMALAHSVENRCPFLDPRLVQFASELPKSYGLREGVEKALLKDAYRGDLPTSITARAKQPYRAPDADIFSQGVGREVAGDALTDSAAFPAFIENKFAHRLTQKIFSSQTRGISPRESQAFLFLLSTIMLNRLFSSAGPGAGSLAARRALKHQIDRT